MIEKAEVGVQCALERRECDTTTRAEFILVELEVARDLLLVVVDGLFAKLVRGFLKLRNC